MIRVTLILILMLAAINGPALDTVPHVYIPGEVLHIDECSIEEPLNILPYSWEYVETWLGGDWSPMVQLPYHCH